MATGTTQSPLARKIAQVIFARLLSLQVASDIERARTQLEAHWQSRLERAQYEVDRARRQYDAVDHGASSSRRSRQPLSPPATKGLPESGGPAPNRRIR
jgi:hypothetical protein